MLLNKIEEMAGCWHLTSFGIEAPEGKALSELLVPKINQALRKLDFENAKAKTHQAFGHFCSFASAFKPPYGDASPLEGPGSRRR